MEAKVETLKKALGVLKLPRINPETLAGQSCHRNRLRDLNCPKVRRRPPTVGGRLIREFTPSTDKLRACRDLVSTEQFASRAWLWIAVRKMLGKNLRFILSRVYLVSLNGMRLLLRDSDICERLSCRLVVRRFC